MHRRVSICFFLPLSDLPLAGDLQAAKHGAGVMDSLWDFLACEPIDLTSIYSTIDFPMGVTVSRCLSACNESCH